MTLGPHGTHPPRHCLVLTVGAPQLLAEAVVQQVIKLTNAAQSQARYVCRFLSSAGGEALAALSPQALGEEPVPYAVLVIAGPDAWASSALQAQLQAVCVAPSHVLAVDAAAALLAEAGAWQGGRAAVNLNLLDALLEEHPAIVWSDRVWEGQGLQWSCGTGLAVVDLLLNWLAQVHGPELAQDLLEPLGLEQIRPREARQRKPLSERLGGGSPKLSEALALMEANLAEPLPTEEIARLVGVSRRQLERLFKQHLDALPSRHYAELRLQKARRLLQQSGQSILQIGLSCGFASGPHFSNAYKAFFGHTPRDERSQRAASLRRGPVANPPSLSVSGALT